MTTHEVVNRIRELEKTVSPIWQHYEHETPAKDWHTIAEMAEILGKAEFTVREWCRRGRVCASKQAWSRRNSHEWIVSREEVDHIAMRGCCRGDAAGLAGSNPRSPARTPAPRDAQGGHRPQPPPIGCPYRTRARAGRARERAGQPVHASDAVPVITDVGSSNRWFFGERHRRRVFGTTGSLVARVGLS